MEILNYGGWRFFIGNDSGFVKEKVGKWMYFFNNSDGRKFAEERCREAVEQEIVWEAKCSEGYEGVACFYLNIDYIERHKRILQFFIDYDMIRRTKAGNLYNISFKRDEQTRTGEYGNDFKPVLKLEEFVDLKTGKIIDKKYL